MSTLKASVERIVKIEPHPNADKLEIAQVLGWSCVVQKGRYHEGQLIVYIPIDSVLPEKLEAKIFGADSKIKLQNHRVKTIKLRGAISQGLVVDMQPLGIYHAKEGEDVTKLLGITKYEPPTPGFQSFNSKRRAPNPNPNLSKYTSIENMKNHSLAFAFDEQVIITEKLHGTNFRCGWVKHVPKSFWQKTLAFMGLAPRLEFVYGSHNVQLGNDLLTPEYSDKNVYARAVVKYDLKNKLKVLSDSFGGMSVAVYGEIIGPGIQKGYHYDVPQGEIRLVLFDLQYEHVNDGMRYASYYDFAFVAEQEIQLPIAPVLFSGEFGKADLHHLVSGDSVFAPGQKVREGVVVRPVQEKTAHFGRKLLKAINPEYLLGDQTDFH